MGLPDLAFVPQPAPLPPLVLGAAPALALAPWHREDPCPVLNALMRAEAAAPHLVRLARFLLPRLPHGVLASSTIKGDGKGSSRVIRLEEAFAHQWVSYNSAHWTNCETVDVDAPRDWRQRLAEAVAEGLPRPAFAVFSPWKGTVHLTWIYDRPIRNDDPDQLRMRLGIKRGLRLVFDADRRFANRLTKNPWHRGEALPDAQAPCGDQAVWDAHRAIGAPLTYHTEIMDLRTVTAVALFHPLAAIATARGVTLMPRKATMPDARTAVRIPGAPERDKRGTRLFFASARATYRARTGNADVIHRIVERTAAALRSPAGPTQIVQIAESITRFMNTDWTGPLDGRHDAQGTTGRGPVDVGAMTGEAADAGPEALDDWRAMDVTSKRKAAAERTAAIVSSGNDRLVMQAIADLIQAGDKVTQAAVAARSGVSLRTVKRRWHALHAGLATCLEKVPDGLIRSCGWAFPAASSPCSEPIHPFPSSLAAVARRSNADSLAVRRELVLCRPYRDQITRMSGPGAHAETVPSPPAGATSALLDAYADACVARDLAEACRVYRDQAARMLVPKAEAEVVPPPLPGAATVLRQAYEAAVAARYMACRRAENRRSKAAAAVRAADRMEWHVQHTGDDVAWQARLADIADMEDRAMRRILDSGRRPFMLDRTRMAYCSIRAAENRAMRRALGEPEPEKRKRLTREERRIESLSLDIPW